MILCQTLQARGACEALRDDEADGDSESVPLIGIPLVDVLQKRRKRAVLERFLEVFISGQRVTGKFCFC